MPVFVIVANNNPAAIKHAIQEQYGVGYYEFSNNVWWVSDSGTSKTVADKIGLTNGAIGAQGAVLKFTGFSGYTAQAAWTWLQQFYPEAAPNA
jgi:hypothetical protein